MGILLCIFRNSFQFHDLQTCLDRLAHLRRKVRKTQTWMVYSLDLMYNMRSERDNLVRGQD